MSGKTKWHKIVRAGLVKEDMTPYVLIEVMALDRVECQNRILVANLK